MNTRDPDFLLQRIAHLEADLRRTNAAYSALLHTLNNNTLQRAKLRGVTS